MKYVAGIDIGGTKCAVSIGRVCEEKVEVVDKIKIPTPKEPLMAVASMVSILEEMTKKQTKKPISAIGISCGGPLDSKKGLILSPPNLPDWNHIDVVTPFEKKFCVPVAVQNDANACALAEWLWGAGRGCRNMIFLTFGTGMGAGLILNGNLYAGTNDMAGEVGHIRLEKEGPIGYNKAGSFEGFCSGGGIAKIGMQMVKKYNEEGKKTQITKIQSELLNITAADIGEAAVRGDELALSIFESVGTQLGKGLSILIDILNPEKIIIGSIFLRQETLLRKPMERIIEQEALKYSNCVCTVVPAGLGENIGEYAAYSVAVNKLKEQNTII